MMEASVAGGQGQAAAGQGQGEGEGAAGQQQSPDFTAFADQLGTMAQGQEEIRQFLQSAPWQQQQQDGGEQEQQLPELDLSMLDPESPTFDAQSVAQSLTGYIEQQAQARADALVKEHIEPLREQQDTLRRSQEARDLVAEFPEMAQEDTARAVLGIAQQFAEANNLPQLAQNVGFWRLIHMAGRAAEMANQEGEDGPPAAHLEGGGGAGPSAGRQAGFTADDIVNARKGASSLPFS
jgi:hypothetical protein